MNIYFLTAFKNEEVVISKLLESVNVQTKKPDYWLFIDNYSHDSTGKIISETIDNINFEIISYGKISDRSTGSNVAHLVNHGIHLLENKFELNENDLVVKIDADIQIDDKNYIDYFINKFSQNELLGIASGAPYILVNGNQVFESKHRWHTRGPNKIYKYSCLKEIQYLKEFKGWDGLDNIFARHIGYLTECFFEQPVRHLYATQTRSEEGGKKGGINREIISYRNRAYPILFAILKGIKLLIQKKLSYEEYCYYNKKTFQVYTKGKVKLSISERKIVYLFLIKRFINGMKY